MITIRDILDKTPIESRHTLIRWRKAGLIPDPDVGPHPCGRGMTSYWPVWVLDRCQRILGLKARGLSLAAIKEALGDDWHREEKLWRESQVMDEPDDLPTPQQVAVTLTAKQRKQLAKRIWRRVQAILGHAAVDGSSLQRSVEQLLARTALLDLAFDYSVRGYNMFLLFVGAEVSIAPDFGLGKRVAENTTPDGCFFVVPLWDDMRDLAAVLDIDFPERPVVRPASQAEWLDGSVPINVEIQTTGKNVMDALVPFTRTTTDKDLPRRLIIRKPLTSECKEESKKRK